MNDRFRSLIGVPVRPGVIVWHTPEQYEELLRGVDQEAAHEHVAPIPEPEEAPLLDMP